MSNRFKTVVSVWMVFSIADSLHHHYDSTLDDSVGQSTRLRRVPNTVNMSSSDENGNPYYCIPLLEEDR